MSTNIESLDISTLVSLRDKSEQSGNWPAAERYEAELERRDEIAEKAVPVLVSAEITFKLTSANLQDYADTYGLNPGEDAFQVFRSHLKDKITELVGADQVLSDFTQFSVSQPK